MDLTDQSYLFGLVFIKVFFICRFCFSQIQKKFQGLTGDAKRVAEQAADIVLMDDEPMQIAKAIKISRKCIGIVYQNIVFALIIKFACLALRVKNL